MPNRLLLADGDPKSLRVLDVSLRKAGFEVTTASTGDAAWEAITSQPPDVIVADSDLPGLDGLALCARVRQDVGSRGIPFICLAADSSVEGKIRGLQAGADEYLTKPAYVNEVIARIRALIQRRARDKLETDPTPPEAFSGSLSDIAVVDLLDLVAGKGRSGIIHLQGGRGGPAAVYFRQGVVIDAEVGRLSGAEAIGRLFGWNEGTFEVEWKNIRRPDVIGRPTTDLVLDGMRRLDEWNRLATQHPDLDGVFEVNYGVLAERLAEIPDEINAILRLIDGKRELGQVVEDSQLSDLDAMNVVARLRDEGIIHEVAQVKAEKSPSSSASPPAGRSADAAHVRTAAPAAGSSPQTAPGRAESLSDSVEESSADTTQAGTHEADGRGPPPPPAPRTTLLRAALPPPPPPPPATKTDRGFPQVDLPASLPDEVTDEDLASLGFSRPANGVDSSPVRGDDPVRDDAVVAFDAESGASSPAAPDATDEGGDALGADDIAALLAGGLDDPEPDLVPASSTGSDASSPADATPRGPASMLQTQRGVGPFPLSSDPAVDSDHAAAAAPDEPARAESPADAADVARIVAESPPAGAGDVQSSPTPEGPAAPPAVATAPASEGTARFVDREISHRDALDELGVRGRRRVIRVLVGALAVAGVATFAVQRVRSAHPGPSVSAPTGGAAVATGSTPPPAVAAEPPRPVQVAEPPPSVPPPSTARPEVAAEVPEAPLPSRQESQAGSKAAIAQAVATAKGTPGAAAPASDAFRRQLADCRGLFAHNRFRDAGVACAAAVETNPRSSEALTMLAHVELNRGHLGRANELAQKAISIHPDQPDAYVIIGGVHQDGGRNTQAKAAYLQYLHLAPHGRYAAELRSIVGSL